MKLSACLIVKDEEKNLEDCLRSLSFADEVIIVDSGSRDRTIEIAKAYTSKVYQRTFDDFAAQKNFALSKAAAPWVLSIDADERVTPELQAEIINIINSGADLNGYRIRRKTFFLGKPFRYSGTQDDRPLRLFKRESGRFRQPIHETLIVDGGVGDLEHVLLHHTTPSIEREIHKTDFYTDLEARFMKEKGVVCGVWAARSRSAGKFLYHYVAKLGFLDGAEGFWFAYYSARYTRRKYEKLAELRRREMLEPKIEERFDGHADKLPDTINPADSRLRALLEACGDVRGKKVLEVGCGKGRFAKIMIAKGADVTGIDPSLALLESARRIEGGRFLQGSATALPWDANAFDVVYAVEVIEHLPFLETSIAEMARVLRPGGILVIIDRNRFSLSQRRFMVPNWVIKRWHEMKNHWIYPNDFPFREHWFTRRQILRILKPHCSEVSARNVQSDGEKKCAWHLIFDLFAFTRLFILWRGVKK